MKRDMKRETCLRNISRKMHSHTKKMYTYTLEVPYPTDISVKDGFSVFMKQIYYTSKRSWSTRVQSVHSWAVHSKSHTRQIYLLKVACASKKIYTCI